MKLNIFGFVTLSSNLLSLLPKCFLKKLIVQSFVMTQKVNKYNKIILKNEDILTFYFLKEPKKKNIG